MMVKFPIICHNCNNIFIADDDNTKKEVGYPSANLGVLYNPVLKTTFVSTCPYCNEKNYIDEELQKKIILNGT